MKWITHYSIVVKCTLLSSQWQFWFHKSSFLDVSAVWQQQRRLISAYLVGVIWTGDQPKNPCEGVFGWVRNLLGLWPWDEATDIKATSHSLSQSATLVVTMGNERNIRLNWPGSLRLRRAMWIEKFPTWQNCENKAKWRWAFWEDNASKSEIRPVFRLTTMSVELLVTFTNPL